MVAIAAIRDAVKAMYPNQTWAKQVNKMDDERVLAIYFKNMKYVEKLPEKEKPPEQGTLF